MTPINPNGCSPIKTFARPSLKAVLSESRVRTGDLEFPLVMHVYSDAIELPVLTIACARHVMQHNRKTGVIRVFSADGAAAQVNASTTSVALDDFENKALTIVREQLELGPPELGGISIRLLQMLQVICIVLSVVVTTAAVGFVAYMVWQDPTELLRSKNPGMVAAYLLPGSGLFGMSVWTKWKIAAIQNARL